MPKKPEKLGITVLGSGSRGNAIVVHTPTEALLVDAGFSARETFRRMQEAGLDHHLIKAIVVSHEHTDHIRGVRVCAKRLNVPVYSNRQTAEVLRERDEDWGQLRIFASGSAFSVGGFDVQPFSIPHDANDPVGFVVRCGDRKVGLATDLGHASHMVCYQLRGCDLLVLESNHDISLLRDSSRPWSLKQRILGRHGHLSNDDSMALLETVLDVRTRHIILAHASQECNRYELVKDCVLQRLAKLGRTDIAAHVARQEEHLPTVWL